MNLKYIVLFSAIFSFFQQLLGQENTSKKDTLVVEINSFEDAKKKAEQIITYLLDSKTIPGMSISVTK